MKPSYTHTLERGILTSAYKREIKENASIVKSESISRMKSIIENHQAKVQSQTGTILRVSLFAIAVIMISF